MKTHLYLCKRKKWLLRIFSELQLVTHYIFYLTIDAEKNKFLYSAYEWLFISVMLLPFARCEIIQIFIRNYKHSANIVEVYFMHWWPGFWIIKARMLISMMSGDLYWIPCHSLPLTCNVRYSTLSYLRHPDYCQPLTLHLTCQVSK